MIEIWLLLLTSVCAICFLLLCIRLAKQAELLRTERDSLNSRMTSMTAQNQALATLNQAYQRRRELDLGGNVRPIGAEAMAVYRKMEAEDDEVRAVLESEKALSEVSQKPRPTAWEKLTRDDFLV